MTSPSWTRWTAATNNRYGDVAFPDGGQAPEGFTEVAIGVPGDQYWTWALRESAILGVLAVASKG